VFSDPSGLYALTGHQQRMMNRFSESTGGAFGGLENFGDNHGGGRNLYRNDYTANSGTESVITSSYTYRKNKTGVGMFFVNLFGGNKNGGHSRTKFVTVNEYTKVQTFSADKEAAAYAYMREFADNNQEHEIAAWITKDNIYVLPVDRNLKYEANHKAKGVNRARIPGVNLKKSHKKVIKGTIIRVNGIRVQLLGEAHTHYEDGSSSPGDAWFSEYNGIPVYDIGPGQVRVTNALSFVYDLNRHSKTTIISTTDDLLNGGFSIMDHATKFSKDKGLYIPQLN